MTISVSLFFFFSSLCILSSVFVIITKNPIFSVLFLIFSFVNTSCLLFLLNFEFLPISFLVIYVGAIAVLFLFILMMLNIKLAELTENFRNFVPFSLLFFVIFITELLIFVRCEFAFVDLSNDNVLFFYEFINRSFFNFDFVNLVSLFTNLKTISIALFSEYVFNFVISGFVLLLAMVAAIALTVQKSFVSSL